MTSSSFRCAVLADIHGNLHALEAVLADLEREKPDVIVNAGDMTGCHFAGSLPVLERLQQAGVQSVMGNQEEFFIDYHDPHGDHELKTAVRLRPMHFFARQMPPAAIEQMKAFPMTLTIPGPRGQDVLVCHASPSHTRRSFALGIDEALAGELNAARASVIACGHLHRQWRQQWQEKLLVMASSAGLPLHGRPGEVEYLLLTYTNDDWKAHYKTVAYDHQAAVDALLATGFLEHSGPMGRLVLVETIYQVDLLSPFFQTHPTLPDPWDEAAWEALIGGYLQEAGHWESLQLWLDTTRSV